MSVFHTLCDYQGSVCPTGMELKLHYVHCSFPWEWPALSVALKFPRYWCVLLSVWITKPAAMYSLTIEDFFSCTLIDWLDTLLVRHLLSCSGHTSYNSFLSKHKSGQYLTSHNIVYRSTDATLSLEPCRLICLFLEHSSYMPECYWDTMVFSTEKMTLWPGSDVDTGSLLRSTVNASAIFTLPVT